MRNQRFFVTALLWVLALCATAAEGLQDSTGMFTENALKQCNFQLVEQEIADVLKQVDHVFADTETWIKKAGDQSAIEIKAITKRLEIARNLKEYILFMQKSDAGKKLLAWQAAKEMSVLLDYFQKEATRAERRAALPDPIIFSVKDFGAKGDGKTDDGPAFRKAFEAVKAANGKPTVLNVPSGTYRIAPSPESLPQTLNLRIADMDGKMIPRPGKLARAHLVLTNVDYFTLRGEKGTKFLFTDSTMLGLRLLGCSESVIENIAIDYADNPSTQGKIISVEKNCESFVVKIDPGFPAVDIPRFVNAPIRLITTRYPGKNELYGDEVLRIGNVERIGHDTFRIFPNPAEKHFSGWQRLKPGRNFSIIARYDFGGNEASAIDFRYCSFGSLKKITVYKSPGNAFRLLRTYAFVLSDVRMDTAPGLPDYVSANADGAQFSGLIGPYVENCFFTKLMDDGFNFNSPSIELERISSDRLQTTPFFPKGAFVISCVTGKIKAVLQTSPDSPKKYLSPLSEDCISKEQVKPLTELERVRLGYTGGAAHKLQNRPDRILQMPSDCSGTVIVDSEFYNIRGLAIQITSPNALIENCKIRDMSAFGININTMLPWEMCFNPHNVVVRNCQFEGNRAPDISIQLRTLKGGRDALAMESIHGIRIENCRFRQNAWCSIELRNAGQVVVSGNSFATRLSAWQAIWCNRIQNITVSDCKFEIPVKDKAIFFVNQDEKSQLKQENNKIQIVGMR
ncbi:MAG: right-handed parallel beta-helix repeat-containing protein [Victivallales bacterium]|jgi:hypothetical protein|nr:right-handed parallel beta-helix repeat-containing protein [Victivallales bacterium]